MSQARWEHFEHEAEVGVRGHGPTREAAFEQAALALTALVTDPTGVRAREAVEIGCAADDDELLLVDWLNAVVYEMAERRMVFGRFRVRISHGELHGEAWGEPVHGDPGEDDVEVKGATYTELLVSQESDGWVAQCVVDV